MVEASALLKTKSWVTDNNIENLDFLCFIGHKENDTIYGSLFNTNNGLVFFRHKWVEINKNKQSPKIYAEMQYTPKAVSSDIWKSFVELDNEDYLQRETIDSQSV